MFLSSLPGGAARSTVSELLTLPPFVVSLSSHEWMARTINSLATKPFDWLRANGFFTCVLGQPSQEKIAPLAKAKPFGGRTAFKIAGISAFALHGAAFGQTNTPEIPPAPLPVWQAHNRSVLIGLDALNRQYTEFDNFGVTFDGILDSEKGTLTGGAIRGRWQGIPLALSVNNTGFRN